MKLYVYVDRGNTGEAIVWDTSDAQLPQQAFSALSTDFEVITIYQKQPFTEKVCSSAINCG